MPTLPPIPLQPDRGRRRFGGFQRSRVLRDKIVINVISQTLGGTRGGRLWWKCAKLSRARQQSSPTSDPPPSLPTLPPMPPLTNSPPNSTSQPGHVLITAFPIIQFRDRLVDRLLTLEKYAPNSDAVATLKECVADVDRALALGRDTNIYMGVDEASSHFRRPRSTISRICRIKRELAGAKKVEGVWVINRHVMTDYFTGDDHGVAA